MDVATTGPLNGERYLRDASLTILQNNDLPLDVK
jgi:hypothetical protein